jgi:ankyrin repeat protein
MPPRLLPNDPSLEHLRKQAKRLRNGVRAGDADAIAQVREFHPRTAEVVGRFSLSDAQVVTARAYGFASWTRLKEHLTDIEPLVWNPPPSPDPRAPLVDVFVGLACLTYGNWHRSNAEKARRLLAQQPELAAANIYTAAAVGDVAALRACIERDPALIDAKGGPLQWEPLLYACYSRLDSSDPEHSTVDVARLLLAKGANPNAGFLWDGRYAYTALTGAFGEGEDSINEPPHPHRDRLARLLLDAGADPNDSQALYNRHFRENDDHLTLLLSYGLGQDKGGPWLPRLGWGRFTPAKLLVEELWSAAKNNFPQRVKLLVEHGVDVNTTGSRDGRTPYEAARRAGNQAIAEFLLQHGARQVEEDPIEAFAVACIAGRREDARARLADNPTLLEALGFHGRLDLLHRAVNAGHLDGVRLIVELGVDVDGKVPGIGLARAPLHNAAIGGNLDMVKLLLELGADPHLRDPTYHAKPIGWAAHSEQRHVVEYLLPFGTIFDAVRFDGVERVAALLREDPSLAGVTDEDGDPLAFYLNPEMPRLAEMIRLLTTHGVELNARNGSGKTVLDRALARGWADFADVLRAHGARTSAETEAEASPGS